MKARAVEWIDHTSPHVWMAIALDHLWEDYSRDAARALLVDEVGRAAVLERVTASTLAAGVTSPATGSVGDNLLMAMLALRVKFTREESNDKLVRNVAMRSESDPRRG